MKKNKRINKIFFQWYDYVGMTGAAGVILYALISLWRIGQTFAPDFSIFYQVGADLIRGVSPYSNPHLYTVFNYPPVTGTLFIPFSFLPYGASQALFIFLSFGALLISIYVSLKLLRLRVSKKIYVYVLALALLSFPVKFTFGMGQVNTIAYMFLLLFLYAGFKKYFLRAGICLALATIFKPILFVFILMFVYKRFSKAFVFFAATLFFITVLGLLFGQLPLYKEYMAVLMPRVSTIMGKGVYYNQNIIAFFVRTFGEVGVSYFLALITSVGIGVYVLSRCLRSRPSELLAFCYISIFLLLANSITWQHHLMFLLFPMIYLFFKMRHRFMNLLFFFVSYFFISSNIKTPSQFFSFPQHFVLSHGVYGVLIIFIFFMLIHERLVRAANRHPLRYNK